MEEASKLASRSNWVPPNHYKVNNFVTYLDNEQEEIFDYLRIVLQSAKQHHIELNNKINSLKLEILHRNNEAKEIIILKLDLAFQKNQI